MSCREALESLASPYLSASFRMKAHFPFRPKIPRPREPKKSTNQLSPVDFLYQCPAWSHVFSIRVAPQLGSHKRILDGSCPSRADPLPDLLCEATGKNRTPGFPGTDLHKMQAVLGYGCMVGTHIGWPGAAQNPLARAPQLARPSGYADPVQDARLTVEGPQQRRLAFRGVRSHRTPLGRRGPQARLLQPGQLHGSVHRERLTHSTREFQRGFQVLRAGSCQGVVDRTSGNAGGRFWYRYGPT